MLEAVYNVLDGTRGGENLLQLYRPDHSGIFVEGTGWEGVWTHNCFMGMFGWLPFLDIRLRNCQRNSQELWFQAQREDGLFPEFVTKDEQFSYYNDHNTEGDVFVDGHWLAVSLICEYILFTRDVEYAKDKIHPLRQAMNFANTRSFKNGLMQVGTGGAIFEQFYNYEGYPSSTQIYYLAALQRMAEVEKLLGNFQQAERFQQKMSPVKQALLKWLLVPEGYFASALDVQGNYHGYRDYFESYPNAMAAPLGIVSDDIACSIVRKIKSIPEVDCNVSMCSNYPARTEKTTVDARGKGFHFNGGAWMGLGGFDVWTHLIAGEYERAEMLIDLMVDMQQNHQLQDRVEDFGRDKDALSGTAGCNHPARHAVGGFGNILRGFLDVHAKADTLELRPHIFPDIEVLTLKIPIRWNKKEIFVKIINAERKLVKDIKVNGISCSLFRGDRISLPFSVLPAVATVEIVYG